MQQSFLVLLTLIVVDVAAQVSAVSEFAGTINSEDLKKHLYIIASAEMEGRETATGGQQKAAAYIEQQFRANGLQAGWNESYQQQFPVYRDSLVKAVLKVGDVELKKDTDFAVSYNSRFNIMLSTGELVFVGYGRSDSVRDDYKGVNAMGRMVMVMPGAPTPATKGKKTRVRVPDLDELQQAAKKNGAAALLVVDSRFPRTPSPAKGAMYIEDFRTENIPNTFFVSDSVAKMIMGTDYTAARKLMRTGAQVSKSYYTQITMELAKHMERLESSNVLGMIEGTEKKDEAIIITSHYDHMGKRDSVIFFGADDDGSGTVSILELAEAFSKAAAAGHKPKRSILFMTVSGEEKGLWGSDYYASNPIIPMEKTSANINIDMIGRVESGRKEDSLNYVYVVGDNRLSSELRPISEEANRRSVNFVLDYKFNDPNDPQRIFYRSDHYNFAKNGVPAIFYFNGLHDDYHRPTDTPDKINYDLLAKRAQLIFYTAWEMANRDDMLKRDRE